MTKSHITILHPIATLTALVALGFLIGLPSGASGHIGEPAHHIQSQDPIATCAPTPAPGPTIVPGLYPIVSFGDITIRRVRLPNGCPTTAMELVICIGNDGPAPSGSFPLRIQGCGVGRIDVQVESIESFDQRCIVIENARIPAGPCELLLDPACDRLFFERHWLGNVPHPAPAPTCTPLPDLTLTPTAVAGTPSPIPTDSPEPATPPSTPPPTTAGTPTPGGAAGRLALPLVVQGRLR